MSRLQKLLNEHFNIDSSEIKDYSSAAKKLDKKLEQYLLDEGIVDEVELYEHAAKEMDVQFMELGNKEIKKEVLNMVPPPVAQAHSIIAFEKDNNEVKLATLDPQDIQTIEFLHRKIGLIPKIFLTTPRSWHR